MRRRIIVVCLFAIVGAPGPMPALGQVTEPRARKFDEFTTGVTSEQWERWRNQESEEKELTLRFGRYARQLRQEGAQPYAIIYSPRVVEWSYSGSSIPAKRSASLWHYLTPLGFDWQSINWVHGGFRDQAATELWIVPPGAQPPCPTPTVSPEAVAYCPSVRVSSVPYVPKASTPLEFKAVVYAGDKRIQPRFHWQVSQGRIVSGQDTDTITVEFTGGTSGGVVTKVEVSGYSLECPVQATAATAITTVGVSHFKFDEFGDIPMGDTKARLDNLAITLQNDPTLQVHIVVYRGRLGPRNQVPNRAAAIKDYLSNTRGLEADRIFTIDGGYRDELSGELWLSLKGTGAPVPRPTIDESYSKPKK